MGTEAQVSIPSISTIFPYDPNEGCRRPYIVFFGSLISSDDNFGEDSFNISAFGTGRGTTTLAASWKCPIRLLKHQKRNKLARGAHPSISHGSFWCFVGCTVRRLVQNVPMLNLTCSSHVPATHSVQPPNLIKNAGSKTQKTIVKNQYK